MRLSPLAAATLLIIALPAHSTTPPSATRNTALPVALGIPAFRMTYRALRNGWHIGTATFTLEREGGDWHFYSEAHATGFASWFFHSTYRESSRFVMADHEIRPLLYSYTDSGRKNRDETIRFDWSTNEARDTNDGHTETLRIAPGMLDRLSAQLKISRELAAGAALTNPYLIVNGGEIKHYHLQRGKHSRITTPTGKFETVMVVRSDPASGRANRFWMAPAYAWLPVKMQQIEPGGATYTFVLDHLEWLTAETDGD